ncbi:MAG: TIGR04219 family outer membrane beta-barrel protein [Gammaproteobacteria bacterium]|nr:TIGR04219 family outer membrane beta-barrel protein [Gammaproteobacteria bacterium]
MKIHKLSFILAGLLSFQAQADTIGFRAGGGIWDHDPGGSFRFQGTNADLDNDFNLKDDKEGYFFVQIEHPAPLIPSVRIQSTKLRSTGTGSVSTSFIFGGTTYNASTNVTTELTLDHTDYTLYWQPLDNFAVFDLGITVKSIDGKSSITDGTTLETNSFDGYIPMLYAAIGFEPMDSLEFRLEVNALGADGNSVTDTTAKVSYTTDLMLGIEAGFRKISIELDDVDQVFANMDFEGPFMGVYMNF